MKAHARWTAGLLAAVLLAVEAVIVAESWRGLTGFAHLVGIGGVAAWGVPVTLDGVSLVAALVALRAELAGEASGLYRLTLFAFTAASAAANYWHGKQTGGEQAALYLGGMSVAVAVVFALALRQIRLEDRRRAGTVTDRLPRFSVAHWARYPRLTWRAWSLAVRDGHASPRTALDAAIGRAPVAAPVTLDRHANRFAGQSGTDPETGSPANPGPVPEPPPGPARRSRTGPGSQSRMRTPSRSSPPRSPPGRFRRCMRSGPGCMSATPVRKPCGSTSPGRRSPPVDRRERRLGKRLAGDEPISDEDYALLERVADAYQAVADEVERRLRSLGFEATTRGFKSTGTLVDKLRRTTLKLKDIHDLAGARIVVDGGRLEQDRVVERIMQAFGSCPKAPLMIDRREKPSHGYRAVHVIVFEDSMPVEIQVRTGLQDKWAQIAEKLGDIWGRGLRYGLGPDLPDARLTPGDPSSSTRGEIVELLLTIADQLSGIEQAGKAFAKVEAELKKELEQDPAANETAPEPIEHIVESLAGLRESIAKGRASADHALDTFVRLLTEQEGAQ
jgi:ppGpp synthetase/RelA/SpoT-type nucleotidyltranferase